MNESGVFAAMMLGIFIIILLLVMSLPVTGTFLGISVSLPLIGWIGLAAFAVLGLVVLLKGK